MTRKRAARVQSVAAMLMLVAAVSIGQTPVKVLFDAGHAQTAGNADWVIDEDVCGTAQRFPTPAQSGITAATPETYWNGAFSSFGVALAKAGYQVESLPGGVPITYGNAGNPQDLANYKVFVLPEPNVRLTAGEKSAILAFVQAGGGLFMIGDHAGSDRNNDGWDSPMVLNDLGESAFGIHYQVSGEANSYFNDNPDDNYTTDATSAIVFTGPFGKCSINKGLGLFGATSMTLNPAVNSGVKGHIWMNTGALGSTAQVTFATATYGGGRVAALGDSSPAEDATNSCGHATHEGWNATLYDNAIIHLNAVAWLAGGNGGGGGPTVTALANGVPVGNVSASLGAWQYFSIAVPAAQSSLVVTTSGGSGDCDLYVRAGALPTTSAYDARSATVGNAESVTVNNPQAATYDIGVYGVSAFSGVTVKATYTGAAGTMNETEPNNTRSSANAIATSGTIITGYVGSSTDSDYFKMSLPAARTLTANLTTPAGVDYDLRLYNSSGSIIGRSETHTGTTEAITWKNAGASTVTVYLRVYGFNGSLSATQPYKLSVSW